jgi:hypothetical protein
MRISPFVLLVLCGCYITTPVPTTPAPAVGTKLHVQLTDNGTTTLAQYLGPNVSYIDGRLLSETDTNVALAVSGTTLRSGDEQYWKGETVSLPHSAIATVQVKKVSWWRSALLAGGAVAVASTITLAAGGFNGGGPRRVTIPTQ